MNKQLTFLSFIVLIAVGAGVWVFKQSNTSQLESELLFADLSSLGSQISAIQVENSQGVLFKAQKDNADWFAQVGANQTSYPVDHTKLASLVSRLSQVKLIEAKTSNTEKYSRLGLQSISVKDSLARLVTIEAGSQSWQVLIGNKVPVGEGRYVRLPEQTQTWRVDKHIDLPVDQYAWLRHPILPFKVEDIQSVSRTFGGNWQLNRDNNSQSFALAELGEDQALQYEGILEGYVSSLVQVDYERLFEPKQSFLDALEPLAEISVTTLQQGTFTLVIGQVDGQYYLSAKAIEQQYYWQQWMYQISSFSASQLNKQLEDFIQQPEPVNVSQLNNVESIEEGLSPE